MGVAPSPEDLSSRVREWLTRRFGCEVTEAEAPARISGGYDFWIYSLGFAGSCLPPEWLSVVARVPPTPERFPLVEREARLQEWCAEHGYPAPKVIELLVPSEVCASPVQIVHRARGDTMTAVMTTRPWRVRGLAGQLGALHARLHRVPVPEWATGGTEWSILERRLALVRFVLERVAHPGLAAGLERVQRLQARLEVASPVVCHGDFHPSNVLVDGDRAAVIDWTDAGIGDPHCDVARTSWLFGFASVAAPTRVERSVVRATAPLLARRYLNNYRRDRPVDPERIRLWMPPHLLHAWAMFVADEAELVGPSRAGTDFRPGLTDWARQQFLAAITTVSD